VAEDNYLKFLQTKLFTNKVEEILHNITARKTHKNTGMLLLIIFLIYFSVAIFRSGPFYPNAVDGDLWDAHSGHKAPLHHIPKMLYWVEIW